MLAEFAGMYEPIVVCLEAIGTSDSNWNSKSMTEANGLLRAISIHCSLSNKSALFWVHQGSELSSARIDTRHFDSPQ